MAYRFSGFAAALAMAALVAASLCAVSSTARPLVPSERRYAPFDTSAMPNCGDPAPLNEILARFHERESEFWLTGLEIVAFEDVREIGFRSNGLDYIPRRYCQAYAHMNDAKVRAISYSIAKDTGGIGDQFGVEWCVQGLDRFDANAPNCKMARP
jgi:hypothetical protein